jgi:hypothetical protein
MPRLRIRLSSLSLLEKQLKPTHVETGRRRNGVMCSGPKPYAVTSCHQRVFGRTSRFSSWEESSIGTAQHLARHLPNIVRWRPSDRKPDSASRVEREAERGTTRHGEPVERQGLLPR